MYIFFFVSDGREDQRMACPGIWFWLYCAFTEKTKSCKGKHFQWYVCIGLSTLTELYCRYILHSIWCFLNFAYHTYSTAPSERTSTKCHVEVVIIIQFNKSANSYNIILAYSYKILRLLLLLLSVAIASTLMQIVPIVSSQCLYQSLY